MSLFWLCITVACLVWYITMVVFVGIRGFIDIFEMLGSLKTSNTYPKARQTD